MIGSGEELLLVDETFWLLKSETGQPAYDFPIEMFLPCRRPWQRPPEIRAIGRIGAFVDYAARYERLLRCGIRLVHDPEEHLRCSELPRWYRLLADLTPRSLWFDEVPNAREVGQMLGWPIFVKGARQTSRHRRSLSIINGPEAFETAMRSYRNDPILRWQRIVCREYVPLRPVEDRWEIPDRIPNSFEFRTFWWRGRLAGFGPYWQSGRSYRPTEAERAEAIAVAREAALRIGTAFPVIDIAQAADGRWLVVECNDGQESGYAGVHPLALWQSLLAFEADPQADSLDDPHRR